MAIRALVRFELVVALIVAGAAGLSGCFIGVEWGDAGTSGAQEAPATLQTHRITFKDLPPPNPRHNAGNGPSVIAQPAGATLTLPPGFRIETFAEGGFKQPRWIAESPNGDVFLADAGLDSVFVLRDTDKDGRAEDRFTFASGLNKPFGIAFTTGSVYVANADSVVRYAYEPGQTEAAGAPERITDLPSSGHWTRNIAVAPDGSALYVTVGSESNVNPEPDPRATVLKMGLDGSNRQIIARGTRNPVGLSFHPKTLALWMSVQERDALGDDLVPDYVAEVKEGAFYGWPYAYVGPHADPRLGGQKPDLVKQTIVPDVLIQAHSAILGLAFYDGTMFPDEYKGGAFAALHGSWNRTKRTGYKIVYLPFAGGKAVGEYRDFVAGWMLGEDRDEVWGRPVAVLPIRDGSMLITDDGANKVWRVSYTAPTPAS